MGRAALRVEEVAVGTPAYEVALAWEREHGREARPPVEDWTTNAAAFPRARSIAYWASVWGGLSTQLQGPDGETQEIDLSQWADRDPARTFVKIVFRYVDPARVGTYAPPPAG
jgi:hypothetical protein